MIIADLGAGTAAAVVSELEAVARRDRLDTEALRERLAEILARIAGADADPSPTIDLRAKPAIILIVGVNGTGKTTTLGKLAWQLRERFGLRVLLGAADTFRAAASEQLEGWAAALGHRHRRPASRGPTPARSRSRRSRRRAPAAMTSR